MENEILDETFKEKTERRRKLLPWWIRFFTWVFMITGVLAPLGFIAGVFGLQYNSSLFGLSTNQPLSLIGLILICLFTINGIAAFGLWMEKDWAIIVGKAVGYIGITTCVLTMFLAPIFTEGDDINLRLEIALLIPFVIRLGKIQREWKKRGFINNYQNS